uniref:Uncharacterized protein n=1 Tax=Moschus moschiferus TaxID=68415 RepID=A0A8C6D0J4_MOSMO
MAPSPIHSDVRLLLIKFHGTCHRATSRQLTELEQAIKYRTVLTNVKSLHLLAVLGHVIWADGALRHLARLPSLPSVGPSAPIFLKRFLVFPILLFPPISFLVHLRRPSYFSLLFSATLHSVWYIYSSLLCFLLFFFPQVFVKPPQTTTLPFLFLGDGFGH